MGKAMRFSEKWFHRGLWLVALLFAWFLIGLGTTIVRDLPRVERHPAIADFMDPQRTAELRAGIRTAEKAAAEAEVALEQAQLRHQFTQSSSRAAKETFANWLATRSVTQRADQDTELLTRTRELDALRAAEREALSVVEAQRQAALDAKQARQRAESALAAMQADARDELEDANRRQELRIFGYRLALTLPLIVVAAWLFARHRRGPSWPFVWGFGLFALFAFFVELVPYLPSYGGYVRYAVGIVMTFVGGRYAIASLQRYLARKRQEEAQPDVQRRHDLDYDHAQGSVANSVCPGCDRAVDLKDGRTDYCPHCGLCLFHRCGHCATRKSAFLRFCFACGTRSPAPEQARPTGPGAPASA